MLEQVVQKCGCPNSGGVQDWAGQGNGQPDVVAYNLVCGVDTVDLHGPFPNQHPL